MTEMVERVERAIEAEMDRDFNAWMDRWGNPAGIADDAPDPPSRYTTSPNKMARAAIEAMRDETEVMGLAGIGAMRGPHTVRGIWNTMIDAALLGDKKGLS